MLSYSDTIQYDRCYCICDIVLRENLRVISVFLASVVFERLVDIICETMAESVDGVDPNGGIPGQPKGQRLTNGDGHVGGHGAGDRSATGCNC